MHRRKQNKKALIRWMISLLICIMLPFAIFTVCTNNNNNKMSVSAAEIPARALDPSVDKVIRSVRNYMLSVDKNPDYSSIWNVIGMSRSSPNAPEEYRKLFYDNTIQYMINNNWDLDTARSSDYAKLILAMTVIGKDARQIDGHNLFDYLDDFDYVKRQGFNGPVWALIAVNSHPEYTFENSTGAQNPTTVETILDYILSREKKVGGWTLYGDVPDTDITAMTIQSLAPFYGKEGRENVTAAVDRALSWLSDSQMTSGGYGTLSNAGVLETSESVSQVIVALSALGIDPADDSRFIKNSAWPVSRLFEYYLPIGGFMHVEKGGANNGGGAAGLLDGMATEQGMYATVAYQRMLEGKTALYDMSDIEIVPGEEVEPSKPDATTEKQEDTTRSSSATTQTKKSKKKVKAVYLDYKRISLQKGKTRTLRVTVSPSNASNKKVKWTSSNPKVATVTQKGKVKGIKAGNATITVTARDGSKKKTTCKVIVYSLNSGNKKTSSGNTGNSSSGNWYNRQTTSGQTNSSGTGNAYYTTGGSGQTSGQTSNSGNTSTDNASTATTEASAWNFDGDTYVADSSGSSSDAEEEFSEDEEEDPHEEESEEEDFSEDEEGEEDDTSDLPTWLSVLLGLVSSGGIAGALRVPWPGLKDKLWILLLSRRRR